MTSAILFWYFVLIKENIADLQEKLRNVEHKLSVTETCKTMLNKEVLALREVRDKLSSDLEVGFSSNLFNSEREIIITQPRTVTKNV